MKIVLFLFSIIFRTNAQVPPCPTGSIQFDPPKYIYSKGIYYPTNSSASPQAVFPDNFICNYKINVPQGMLASVRVTFNMGNPGNETFPVIVTDQLQRSEGFYSADTEPFYFLSNGGSISLKTGMTNTNFGFSIYWRKLPTTFTPNLINIYKSGTQPQTLDQFDSGSFLVTAETRVSVLMVPLRRSDKNVYLRGLMIYDGPDWNSTCLGTGYQLSKSNTQWVSTGTQMTIQYLAAYFYPGDVRLIFQDYENTKSIVQYEGVLCPSDKQSQVTLENSKSPSAIITYIDSYGNYGSETVTKLDGNGTLDVYIGGVTSSKKNLIASYQVNNSALLFPQTFPGNMRTYVLNGINSKATVSFDCNAYYYYIIGSYNQSIGSKGFITSNHYMESYTGQYVSAGFSTLKGLASFSLVIRFLDITKNTNFNVMVTNKGTVVYNEEYNMTNLPVLNKPITAIGDRLTVNFDTKKDNSKGLYMDFELLKGSSNFFVFVSILITSLNIYFS